MSLTCTALILLGLNGYLGPYSRAKSPQTWDLENEPLHAALAEVLRVCLKWPHKVSGETLYVAWHRVQAGFSAPLTFLALDQVPSCSESKKAPSHWAETCYIGPL